MSKPEKKASGGGAGRRFSVLGKSSKRHADSGPLAVAAAATAAEAAAAAAEAGGGGDFEF